MNRIVVLLVALCEAVVMVGCINRSVDLPQLKNIPSEKPKIVEVQKPPEVKRGKPIAYKMADYDVREWKSKTKTGSDLWFKVDGNDWYIDWDADRKPFGMVVIHHTATSPTTTSEEIDVIQKERLYVPRYRSGGGPFVKGLPIHSGHVVDGKERYIGYHHLVYSNGKVTTELSPLVKISDAWYIDHVGWHTGKWEVNCRSVAICLVGDFSDKEPPDVQLQATAGLIAYYRSLNPRMTVTSHGDHTKTECPGKTWRIWREKIMQK